MQWKVSSFKSKKPKERNRNTFLPICIFEMPFWKAPKLLVPLPARPFLESRQWCSTGSVCEVSVNPFPGCEMWGRFSNLPWLLLLLGQGCSSRSSKLYTLNVRFGGALRVREGNGPRLLIVLQLLNCCFSHLFIMFFLVVFCISG